MSEPVSAVSTGRTKALTRASEMPMRSKSMSPALPISSKGSSRM